MLLGVSWAKSWWHNFMTLPPLSLPGHKPPPDSGEQSGAPVLWYYAHQRDPRLILSAVSVDWRALDSFIKIRYSKYREPYRLAWSPHSSGSFGYVLSPCWLSDASSCWGCVAPVLAVSITEPELWCGRQLPRGCLPFLLSLRANLTAVLLICNRAFSPVYVLCFRSGVCNLYNTTDCPPPGRMGELETILPLPRQKDW